MLDPEREDLKYQEGPGGTRAFGLEGSVSRGIRGSYGIQIVADNKGNVGLLRYVTGGIGSPTKALSTTFTFTNADTVADLKGGGFAFGGSYGRLGYEYMGGDGYTGHTPSTGTDFDKASGELHGEGTYSTVTDITEFVERFGLKDDIYKVLMMNPGGTP